MPLLKVDDASFNYHLDDFTDPWVESRVILMHHGYSRNSKFWTSWVPGLARKYKILRFDVRGCGESSVPPKEYLWATEKLAQDALAIIDRLGVPRVNWVGESAGGILGILFAALYSERVQSLILCDTPFKFGDRMYADYSAGQEEPAVAVEKLGFKEWLARTMGHRIDLTNADPRLVQWYAGEMLKTPEHVAIALMRIFSKADVSSLMPKVKAPTLVLAGAQSPIAGPDQQRVIKEKIPQARVHTFDGLGHGIFLLAPERCTAAVLNFLETIE